MPQPFTEQIQVTGMMIIQILIVSEYRLGRFKVVVSRHTTCLTSQSALSTKSSLRLNLVA